MLWFENASTIASFIFKDILCCWGTVSKLVTNNGTPYVQALDILANWYGICHIQISPYNSQANTMVEQHHYNVQEAIVKSPLGGEVRWPLITHSVFQAEHITILKSTRLLLYFMVYGIELLFPFDLTKATFLVPVSDTDPVSRSSLIAWKAQKLQKHWEDIDTIHKHVLLSQFVFLWQFKT